MTYALKATFADGQTKYLSYTRDQTILNADFVDKPLDAKRWQGKRWASKALIAISDRRDASIKNLEVIEVYP